MNLRDKFLWNMTIVLSTLAIIWTIWNVFNMSLEANKSLSLYKNEQVGADKTLESKVMELENIYIGRDSMKFRMVENPVDLNKVISMSFANGTSKRRKNLWVSSIYTGRSGQHIAIINYKDKEHKVSKGDSIAGGLITGISRTELIFEKNEKIHTYYLGLINQENE